MIPVKLDSKKCGFVGISLTGNVLDSAIVPISIGVNKSKYGTAAFVKLLITHKSWAMYDGIDYAAHDIILPLHKGAIY